MSTSTQISSIANGIDVAHNHVKDALDIMESLDFQEFQERLPGSEVLIKDFKKVIQLLDEAEQRLR